MALLAIALGVLGCGPSPRLDRAAGPETDRGSAATDRGGTAADAAPTTETAQAAAEIPLAALGVERAGVAGTADDPAWRLEQHSERIQQVLDELVHQLEQSGPSAAERLIAVASDDVRCASLRPRQLIDVYRDDTIQVRRAPELASTERPAVTDSPTPASGNFVARSSTR